MSDYREYFMLQEDTRFFYAFDLPLAGFRALHTANKADKIPSADWLIYDATDADLLAFPGFGRTSLARFREAIPEIKKVRSDRGRILAFPRHTPPDAS